MKLSLITGVSKGIRNLAAIAEADGHRNINTLISEFEAGVNCFDKPGEALFGAYNGTTIVGIGGVNIDPFENLAVVARVRRVFVAPAVRRRGVASVLMDEIERIARGHFSKVQLYTTSATASHFYIARGYSPVYGRPRVSHEKLFAV
ncbi:MAG: GNAT family N-acetyltransferase [Gammaproteobacteria bacterium]|nr:GNAT family N-acetyltransferase [Gammaproteobacteria bacterium]MCZ6659222.1 GNAT family N-acetyltransferase [Gammaproteobacteria bacterium]